MQSTVVHGCSLRKMDALILFYFYQQCWIGAASRRSQCDEGFGGGGPLYICPVSIATVGLGLEFLTTVFLTTFKQASCWMRSNVATKLCASANKGGCWGRDEASLHRDRLSFLCYSVFLFIRGVSVAICAQARGSSHLKNFGNFKKGRLLYHLLNRRRPSQSPSLVCYPAEFDAWRHGLWWHKREHCLVLDIVL